MNQAGNVILAFALYRHHIAALANGDDGLPEVLAVGGRRKDLLLAAPDLSGLDAHMAADVSQCGRGVIGDLFLGKDSTEYLVF